MSGFPFGDDPEGANPVCQFDLGGPQLDPMSRMGEDPDPSFPQNHQKLAFEQGADLILGWGILVGTPVAFWGFLPDCCPQNLSVHPLLPAPRSAC